MTNQYEITPSNDDDEPLSMVSSAAELDADTSFEIDEPEDEEVLVDTHLIDVENSNVACGVGDTAEATTNTTAASAAAVASIDDALRLAMLNGRMAVKRQSVDVLTNPTPTNRSTNGDSDTSDDDDSHNSHTPTHRKACEDCSPRSSMHQYTVPHVTIRGDDSPTAAYGDESDEQQTDTSDAAEENSHTASSTPTTADVADVSTTVAAKRLAAQQQQHNKVNSHCDASVRTTSAAAANRANASPAITQLSVGTDADNLSTSVATTTTEVDLDGIASVSPVTNARLFAGHNVQPQTHMRQSQHSANTSTALHISRHDDDDDDDDDEEDDDEETTAAEAAAPAAAVAQRKANLLHHKRTQSASSYRSIHSNNGGSLHAAQSLPVVQTVSPWSRGIFHWLYRLCQLFKSSGIGEPSVYHAVIVIFLEFFAWGLLAMPVISVLNQTFPDHTFLMNGLVMGIKGILSFLSAPLVGALSDIWGRKFFLLITVFFTCAPIPLMTINSWWFFAMISISGVFAVTFSVVFAYVADVTTVEERSRAYGLVSATFAASLVISPALGALLREKYSDTLVVALATAIAVLDVFFILVAVPESLPEKMRPQSWGTPISWEQADPFSALRKVGTDRTILMQCVTVLLSYLPEAGQYSCIFVYLKLKMGFNSMEVAIFIAVVGILSISVQVILGYLMRVLGGKRTIILGLILEMIQLLWYGFGSQAWMMWSAGILAAIASITYPAISAFVSLHSTADSQGVVQGIITGMRGLCNGLGPAMFGVIFYFFNVDLNGQDGRVDATSDAESVSKHTASLVPGPPFAIGAILVILAIVVAIFIPDGNGETILSRAPSEKKRPSKDVQYTLAQL